MKIQGVEIEFTNQNPLKEGKFLWRHSQGVMVIDVVYRPESHPYGGHLKGYYGVEQLLGRNVLKLSGEFVEIEGE